MHIECVDGAEVTSHSAELLSVDSVVEPGLELALRRAGGGHGLGVLSSSEENVGVGRRDHGTVDWALRAVQTHHLEVLGVDELRRAVSGGSDHHGLVSVEV